MQRNVVEDRIDVGVLQVRKCPRMFLRVLDQDVVDVRIVLHMIGNDGPAKQAVLLERLKRFLIELPNPESPAGQLFGGLELRPEKRGVQLAEPI